MSDRTYNKEFQRAIWFVRAEMVAGGRAEAGSSAYTLLKGHLPRPYGLYFLLSLKYSPLVYAI